MSTLKLNEDNIAKTGRGRQYEFIGTLAIDHAGQGTIEKLVMVDTQKYTKQGYYFAGIKMQTGFPSTFLRSDKITVNVVLCKYDKENETKEFISLNRNVSAKDLLQACVNLVIQFTNINSFENDEIEWNNLHNPEKD